jgi:hypothetical protein
LTASPGWASSVEARSKLLSYIAYPGDPEPSSAIADAWTEAPMALTGDVCDRVLASARRSQPLLSGNGTYYLPEVSAEDRDAVVGRFAAANSLWWNLDLAEWYIGVKRYRPGESHAPHQDVHPGGGARRKLAGVVQLSDPDAYQGGDLVVRFAHHAITMPRARGALIAMPSWTCHEVTAVTAGERWSLICNADGPTPLR